MILFSAIERRPMRAFVVITVIAAVASAWLLQGYLVHFGYFLSTILIGLLTGIVMVAAFLGSLGAWAFGQRGRPWSSRLRRVGLIALVIHGSAIGSLILAMDTRHRLEASAKAWATEQVPAIERYRESFGTYPRSLEETTDLSDSPRLVRNGDLLYTGDPQRFSFDLRTGLISGWWWSSDSREWGYYD